MATAPVRAGTRERLIVAAERLFVERSIGAVPLREVSAAAGQRNTAAAQYHFGSKEALVVAIVEYRMQPINERRLTLLADMQAQGQVRDLRSMMEALVFPLAAAVGSQGSYYGRFLAQLHSDPNYSPTYDWDTATSFRLARKGVEDCLVDLPDLVVQERLRMVASLLVHTTAYHEAAACHQDDDGTKAPSWAIMLVDAACGLLTAPLSIP